MSERREYPLSLKINNRQIKRVIIDQHYKLKHPEINDWLILLLVRQLNGGHFPIDKEKDGFQYLVIEPVVYKDKPYRLILLLYIYDDFLRVINAFRIKSK